jgi:hypothetical protein
MEDSKNINALYRIKLSDNPKDFFAQILGKKVITLYQLHEAFSNMELHQKVNSQDDKFISVKDLIEYLKYHKKNPFKYKEPQSAYIIRVNHFIDKLVEEFEDDKI